MKDQSTLLILAVIAVGGLYLATKGKTPTQVATGTTTPSAIGHSPTATTTDYITKVTAAGNQTAQDIQTAASLVTAGTSVFSKLGSLFSSSTPASATANTASNAASSFDIPNYSDSVANVDITQEG